MKLRSAPSYTSPHPSPRFLTDPTPSTVLVLLEEADRTQSAEGDDLSTTVILRHVIRCAVEHADLELIAWMVALQGRWVCLPLVIFQLTDSDQAEMLNDIVKVMADDDGWGLVGMAVQSSCGRQETEEGVRAIISRWGLETGPRGGRDNSELQIRPSSRLLNIYDASRLDTTSPCGADLYPSPDFLPLDPRRFSTCAHEPRPYTARPRLRHV